MFVRRSLDAIVAVTLAGALQMLAAPAHAQSASKLAELERIHERIAQPEQVLAPADIRAAKSRLSELNFTLEQLDRAASLRLLRTQLYIALAEGDAGAARTRALALQERTPDDKASLIAMLYAATAAGDAQLASNTLRSLSRALESDERSDFAARRPRLRLIGEQAPEVTITTEDDGDVVVQRRRGKVLVLDFWNTLFEPPAEQRAGMRDLWETYRFDRNVEIVGVNSDSPGKVDEARAWAESEKYAWPMHYERQGLRSPIAREFRASRPPWTVVVDSFGFIRAIGGAADPDLRYAIRAAAREAAGEAQAVLPRQRDGTQPKPPGDAAAAATGGTRGEQPADDTGGYAPSNPDAKRLLDQARTYIRTGLKTDARKLLERIIAEYPNTREAEDAQSYLESL